MTADLPAWIPADPGTSPALPIVEGREGRVVVLLCTEGALAAGWAAAVAVDLVASWSQAGTRVVAADAGISTPLLHEALGIPNHEGLVDALRWGVSVQRVIQRPQGRSFLALTAGTAVADTNAVLSLQRWPALCAGFREAGVTLVVLVPSWEDALSAVLGQADAIVILGEREEDPGDLMLDAGAPVLAVIGRDESSDVEDGAASGPATPGAGEVPDAESDEMPVESPPEDAAMEEAAPEDAVMEEAAPEDALTPDEGSEDSAEDGRSDDGTFPVGEPPLESSADAVSDVQAEEPAVESMDLGGIWSSEAGEAESPTESASGGFGVEDDEPETEPAPEPLDQVAGDDEELPEASHWGALPDDDASFGETGTEEGWEAESDELVPSPGAEPDEDSGSLAEAAQGDPFVLPDPIPVPPSLEEIVEESEPPAPRGRTGMLLLVLLIVVVGVVAAAWFGYVDIPGITPGRGTASSAPPPATAPAPAPVNEVSPVQEYSLALGAYRDGVVAGQRVTALAGQVPGVLFQSVPVEVEGTLYYRVLAGPAVDSAAVVSLASHISEAAGISSSPWVARWTPLAFQMGEFADREAADRRIGALNGLGVSAYVLAVDYSDGSIRYRVFAGAFADTAEASYFSGFLDERGLSSSTLSDRIGRLPE